MSAGSRGAGNEHGSGEREFLPRHPLPCAAALPSRAPPPRLPSPHRLARSCRREPGRTSLLARCPYPPSLSVRNSPGRRALGGGGAPGVMGVCVSEWAPKRAHLGCAPRTPGTARQLKEGGSQRGVRSAGRWQLPFANSTSPGRAWERKERISPCHLSLNQFQPCGGARPGVAVTLRPRGKSQAAVGTAPRSRARGCGGIKPAGRAKQAATQQDHPAGC